MNSEAASSYSQLRAAVPTKRARVEEEVQTNETMQDLDGTIEQLENTRGELDEITKTMLGTEEDRDMWKKLFEDCNKKQGEEIERLRRGYKERSERLALTTAVEKVIPAKNIPRGQSPIEFLTPLELSQTTETRLPATTGRAKIDRNSWRLIAYRNAPGSGVTAPYGTIDDTGRVQLSQEMMTRTEVSDTTLPKKSSKVPDRKIREVPMKKMSQIIDVQKNIQLKYSFTGVLDTDSRAFFSPLGTQQ